MDYVEKTVAGGSPSKAYPVYDAHGNMIATISTYGTLSNKRQYDVWGGVRTQTAVDAVNPSERYVGNLGHKSDDESGLIYMRARYYDPGSGRFVSEDPAMDGPNWFVYCSNDPVNYVDRNGREAGLPNLLGWLHIAAIGAGMGLGVYWGTAAYVALRGAAGLHERTGLATPLEIHDNFFSVVIKGGIGAVIGALIEIGIVSPAVASIGAMGSIGLAFGVGVFMGFLFGFYAAMLQDMMANPYADRVPTV